jgi:hypothetical protein
MVPHGQLISLKFKGCIFLFTPQYSHNSPQLKTVFPPYCPRVNPHLKTGKIPFYTFFKNGKFAKPIKRNQSTKYFRTFLVSQFGVI